jgi:hypothetical protein
VAQTLQVKNRKTADLIPYARNAKKHSEKQILAIAASIKEFGFNNPVLIDGENGIIAGHGRVMAAQKLGIDNVPTIALGHLTESQKRAFILADNRLSEIGGGWDNEMLMVELADIGNSDVSVDITGFDPKDISETAKLSELKFESIYYEPKEKPTMPLSDCLDLKKFKAKMDVVEGSSLSDHQKEVMKFFCQRFIKIDFENVANYYYFNATEEEKKVMERLRLVLCDSGLQGFIEDDLLHCHQSIAGWEEEDD